VKPDDPWAPKVDLTSVEDKRKAAQLKFESSEENVAKERHKMQAQTEVKILFSIYLCNTLTKKIADSAKIERATPGRARF
jgi:hypothetical protein